MKTTDTFRLKCMHLALDSIAQATDGGEDSRLQWEPGRIFVLDEIQKMRRLFDYYEKESKRHA